MRTNFQRKRIVPAARFVSGPLSYKEEIIMKASVKISLFFLPAAAASFVLASCGNSSPKQESGASSAESASTPSVTKVNIGTRMDYDVISYIDADSGELMGFDIDMFKLLDEALPQYEFIYDPVGQEAILMGLDAGQYQAGLGGYFYNAERAEKYLAAVTGLWRKS